MTPQDSEKILQEAEERLRKKRALLGELRRTEGLGEVVATVAYAMASAPEGEKPPGPLRPRRTKVRASGNRRLRRRARVPARAIMKAAQAPQTRATARIREGVDEGSDDRACAASARMVTTAPTTPAVGMVKKRAAELSRLVK